MKAAETKHLPVEIVEVDSLKPHPRNYVQHPADQLKHIVASIKQHGFYRNVVIARDGTILAGHGVWQAVKSMGWDTLPVVRLPLAPTDARAIKILVGDNEIRHLAEIDDLALSELLKEVKETDVEQLLGTGYDDMMLANLIFTTRPASEIKDKDQAAAWAGMPEYKNDEIFDLKLNFRTKEDKAKCLELLKLKVANMDTKGSTVWWPTAPEKRDMISVKFETGVKKNGRMDREAASGRRPSDGENKPAETLQT